MNYGEGTFPRKAQRDAGVEQEFGTYPLFLGGHKGLESRGHPKSQLLDEGRLRLAVDLHFDSGLERRVLWKRSGRLRSSRTAGMFRSLVTEGGNPEAGFAGSRPLLGLIQNHLPLVPGASLAPDPAPPPWNSGSPPPWNSGSSLL